MAVWLQILVPTLGVGTLCLATLRVAGSGRGAAGEVRSHARRGNEVKGQVKLFGPRSHTPPAKASGTCGAGGVGDAGWPLPSGALRTSDSILPSRMRTTRLAQAAMSFSCV